MEIRKTDLEYIIKRFEICKKDNPTYTMKQIQNSVKIPVWKYYQSKRLLKKIEENEMIEKQEKSFEKMIEKEIGKIKKIEENHTITITLNQKAYDIAKKYLQTVNLDERLIPEMCQIWLHITILKKGE